MCGSRRLHKGRRPHTDWTGIGSGVPAWMTKRHQSELVVGIVSVAPRSGRSSSQRLPIRPIRRSLSGQTRHVIRQSSGGIVSHRRYEPLGWQRQRQPVESGPSSARGTAGAITRM